MNNLLLNYADEATFYVVPQHKCYKLYPNEPLALDDWFYDDIGIDVKKDHVVVSRRVWDEWSNDPDITITKLS